MEVECDETASRMAVDEPGKPEGIAVGNHPVLSKASHPMGAETHRLFRLGRHHNQWAFPLQKADHSQHHDGLSFAHVSLEPDTMPSWINLSSFNHTHASLSLI